MGKVVAVMCFNERMELSGLIDELEATFSAARRAQEREEVYELAQAELTEITLVERLRTSIGSEVRCMSDAGAQAQGRLLRVGQNWLLLDQAGRQVLVNLSNCSVLQGVARHASAASILERKLPMNSVLRSLMHNRQRVKIAVQQLSIAGWIGAVYADHFEIRSAERAYTVRSESIFSCECVL
ncbi:hypothetical protein [Gleimia hominis]|nr:hypothetical protein [Gleimia hominis]